MAAAKGSQAMHSMLATSAFFSLIRALLVSLTHKWIGWKSYGMLAFR